MRRLLLALLCVSPFVSACQSEGARQGATHGAIYGAFGTAVSSVVWGRDDVLGDAARGAVVGATVGGVDGAVRENQRENAKAAQDAEAAKNARLAAENAELSQRNHQLELERRLTAEIGPDNTEAIRLLVNCDHQGAVLAARRSADASSEPFRQAGMWIEALAAYDRRDLSTAKMFYPRLAEAVPDVADAEAAETTVIELAGKLEDTRASFGLPRRCR